MKHGKLSAKLMASHPCVLGFLHPISQVIQLHLSRKIILTNLTSDAPKCNPSQEVSALTSKHLWWTCLLYCACHPTCIFADPLQIFHACHRFSKCYKLLMFCSLLGRCRNPCACHTTGHRNVQKWSERGVLLAFWLRNVLRPTTPCSFSFHLASWLRTSRFRKHALRPYGATNHWKNTVIRDPFGAPASSSFSLYTCINKYMYIYIDVYMHLYLYSYLHLNLYLYLGLCVLYGW